MVDLSVIIDSYDKLSKEYEEEAVKIDAKMKELGKYLKNIRQLAVSQGDFYSYYQTLISRRRELRKFAASIIRPISKEKRKVLDSYKSGTQKSIYVSDVTILPKNDFERNVYLDDDMSEVLLVEKLVNDHMSYMTDNIDNMQRMILGIKYSIEMEKYRESMG